MSLRAGPVGVHDCCIPVKVYHQRPNFNSIMWVKNTGPRGEVVSGFEDEGVKVGAFR